MSDQVLFGRKIRAARKAATLSRDRVAERAGITSNYLGEIERGEKWPSIEIISSIAAALDVPPSLFLSYESEEPNANLLKAKIRHILERRGLADLQRAYRMLKALFEP